MQWNFESSKNPRLFLLVFDFFPCAGILLVRERQNAINFDKSLHWNSCFSINAGLISSTKVEFKKSFLPEEFLVGKLSIPILQRNPEFFLIWTYLDFQCRCSRRMLTRVIFKVWIKSFLVFLDYLIEFLHFSSMQCNSVGPEMSESAVNLLMPR